METRKVGKYEVCRTIGEGTFAKVKFAINTETGESVAMKVLAKATILKHKMVHQELDFFTQHVGPQTMLLLRSMQQNFPAHLGFLQKLN
ncbi:CBL-interacting serine/threonine-protein kinase 8-like [Phoenix dactylifera]|uniref:non-specific serine/threonine protein kinase n=1 Tax=Phoenix dactylifera TaxID=42345 RepID=A0A8B9AJE6_PHODC|nr:CBL-interacting serine/threonine-protein kinase 8-like [Phoenix dactylifera]